MKFHQPRLGLWIVAGALLFFSGFVSGKRAASASDEAGAKNHEPSVAGSQINSDVAAVPGKEEEFNTFGTSDLSKLKVPAVVPPFPQYLSVDTAGGTNQNAWPIPLSFESANDLRAWCRWNIHDDHPFEQIVEGKKTVITELDYGNSLRRVAVSAYSQFGSGYALTFLLMTNNSDVEPLVSRDGNWVLLRGGNGRTLMLVSKYGMFPTLGVPDR